MMSIRREHMEYCYVAMFRMHCPDFVCPKPLKS